MRYEDHLSRRSHRCVPPEAAVQTASHSLYNFGSIMQDDLADVYDNVTSSTRDQMVSLQQEMTREVAMDDAEEYQNEANSTGLLVTECYTYDVKQTIRALN